MTHRMPPSQSYPDGQHLLNRRGFLQSAGAGLGGIALSASLAEQGMLSAAAAGTPIRPMIDPTRPLAARLPHFKPRAKNVLVIFCSGACSHLDSWDYKPELVKHHGQPMPGNEGLGPSALGAITMPTFPSVPECLRQPPCKN